MNQSRTARRFLAGSAYRPHPLRLLGSAIYIHGTNSFLLVAMVLVGVTSWSCDDCPQVNATHSCQGKGTVEVTTENGIWPVRGNVALECTFGLPFEPLGARSITIIARLAMPEAESNCDEELLVYHECEEVLIRTTLDQFVPEGQTVTFSGNDLPTHEQDTASGAWIQFFGTSAIPGMDPPPSLASHYLLDSGAIKTIALYPSENSMEFSLRYLPNPKYEAYLRSLGAWHNWVNVAGECHCVPESQTWCEE